MAKSVLTADLTELAGPVGQNSRKTGICQMGIVGEAASVKASADSPAAVDTVFGVGIEAEGVLGFEETGGAVGKLVAVAPDKFVAEKEGMVNGAAQRLPAQGGIDAVQIREEVVTL